MSAKEQVLRVIQDLPESSTWADIEECVRFVAAIEIGLDDVQAGRVVTHESVVLSAIVASQGGKAATQTKDDYELS